MSSAVVSVRRPPARALPWVLGALTIACEVPYPLVTGRARAALTVAAVLGFFAAAASHAAVARGARWATAAMGTSAVVGFAVEAVGTRTGVPFGRYHYTDGLGPTLAGVPVVIPLAWAMMAYPALLVARRIARSRPARVAVGAVALAAWDLFLDPQMVAAGHWQWRSAAPTLPGVPDVPLTNYIGWLGAAALLMLLLDRLPAVPADDRMPLALYVWTFGSSVLANLVFFSRPFVALWGGLAMGAVVVALWRRR